MKFGWIITSVIHGVAFVAAVFSFGSVTPLELDNVVPVEVEIISVAPIEQVGKKQEEDLTTKKADKQPIKKPVPKPIPKPKKPTEKPTEKPKPKADVPKPTPKVDKSEPSIEKLIEEAAEPTPTPKTARITSAPKPLKRPPVPKPKAEPNPLDDSKISALLDKLESKPLEDIDLDFGDLETGTLNGDFTDEIEVASLSQFEFNAVKNRMVACWSIPAGAQDADNVVVKIGFNLNRNAEVVGSPQVLNFSSHPSFAVMADAAIRAIIDCAPYDMLPPEKFDVWNEFAMEFDPSSMFGG